MTKQIKEQIYYTNGMHCPSCEVLIERKLLEQDGVKSVSASTPKGEVVIEYSGHKPESEELNKLFKKEGYSFSERPLGAGTPPKTNWRAIILLPVVVILGTLFLEKFKVGALINITAASSLPVIFFFGLVAGVSSCAALVGGIVLSMSKQWNELYAASESVFKKMEPHLTFNAGRLVSYTVLGGALGAIGKTIQLSSFFAPLLIIAVSAVMIILGLQMLGVRALSKFQIAAPKILTRNIADERNFKGRYMPFFLGALTFFLPCGFTLAAQAVALITGSVLQSALIMMFFALGTMPSLLVIGFSAVKFREKTKFSDKFNIVAAVLIIFFGFFNANAQLNVLGYSSLSDIKFGSSGDTAVCKTAACDIDKAFGNGTSSPKVTSGNGSADLPPIVDGTQIVKTQASAYGYSPKNLKAKAGIPIRWEITDTGTSGCTNAIISRSLFDGQINLTPGQTSVKEFTADKAGIYKFSCWMGMVSGTFEIVN